MICLCIKAENRSGYSNISIIKLICKIVFNLRNKLKISRDLKLNIVLAYLITAYIYIIVTYRFSDVLQINILCTYAVMLLIYY